MLIEVVVLPTPPFWFATAITRGRLRAGVCEGVDDGEISLINDTLPRITQLRNPFQTELFPGKQFRFSFKLRRTVSVMEFQQCYPQAVVSWETLVSPGDDGNRS